MTVLKGLLSLLGVSAVIGLAGLFNSSIGLAPFLVVIMATVLFWITQATSWNLLSGYAGYFSFGQGAYLGVGVYTMAVLTGRHGVPYLISIPVGGLLAALLALVIGAIAFRLRSLRGEIAIGDVSRRERPHQDAGEQIADQRRQMQPVRQITEPGREHKADGKGGEKGNVLMQ